MKMYEAMILSAHEDYVNQRLEKAQAEGWEVAGEMLVKQANDGALFLYIPMKREVNQKINES